MSTLSYFCLYPGRHSHYASIMGTGDANMRSVWICSRNDVIGNLAVLTAAAGVFGTSTAWPDLLVAGIMAALGMSGGWQIIRQANAELTDSKLTPVGVTH
jgi:Co/Zn/Cd efflux system component